MRLFSTVTAILLTAGAATAPAHTPVQDRFANVEIKSVRVSGNIYMLEGAGGNIGVSVGEDGILIIDDQFAPLADKIRAALEKLNKGKLRFVLNTHWHGDHTGGNPEFGTEANIIAHSNVRKRLSTRSQARGRVHEPMAKEGLPVITFDESLSVHFNGEEIRLIHLPHAHTDGDSAIFFTKSNVVHLGDTFFAGAFPFVDLGSGGSVEGLIEQVEALIRRIPADAKIIPGHGSLSSRKDLMAYYQMLVDTTTHIRSRMNAGKSADEIKSEGLPAKWESWGTGFINAEGWIDIVIQSYSEKAGEKD